MLVPTESIEVMYFENKMGEFRYIWSTCQFQECFREISRKFTKISGINRFRLDFLVTGIISTCGLIRCYLNRPVRWTMVYGGQVQTAFIQYYELNFFQKTVIATLVLHFLQQQLYFNCHEHFVSFSAKIQHWSHIYKFMWCKLDIHKLI